MSKLTSEQRDTLYSILIESEKSIFDEEEEEEDDTDER